jgi:hypothetical protein
MLCWKAKKIGAALLLSGLHFAQFFDYVIPGGA